MKRIFAIVLCGIALSGCGAADRMGAALTGGGSETCIDGVVYLQFTSGVTVKYNADGTIATCKK
jgi:hypothetical protein